MVHFWSANTSIVHHYFLLKNSNPCISRSTVRWPWPPCSGWCPNAATCSATQNGDWSSSFRNSTSKGPSVFDVRTFWAKWQERFAFVTVSNISKWDQLLHFYSTQKQKCVFFCLKQMPRGSWATFWDPSSMETEIGKSDHFCSTAGEVRRLREAGTLPAQLRLDPRTRGWSEASAPHGILLVRLVFGQDPIL